MAIALSSGVRLALASLQSTSNAAQTAQTRLATGKKVNSALDNPSNFFTAAGLTNRSNDLSRLLDGIGQAVKTLEAADKGIKSLQKLVETAQATARQALQSASTTPKLTSVKTAITSTTKNVDAEGGGFVAGNTITVTYNGTSTSAAFAVTATSTVQDLANFINADDTLQGGATAADASRVKASVENGKLVIESLDGKSVSIAAADGTGAAGTAAIGLANLFGTATSAAASTNTTRESLSKQFNDLRSQIDGLVKDTGYSGVNLLGGDSLKVQFNETNTTSLTVTGVKYDSTTLGITASLTTNTFQSDTEINAALAKLDTALGTLRTQASAFGSNLSVAQNRQDFTKSMIDTLRSGSDALVLADANEEGANLLALNTRAQLSQTALSLASQADQAVLRLF